MVAFITGGANGIGKQIAVSFAEQGYDIAISYRTNILDAEKVAETIKKLGRKCVIIKADLSRYCDIQNMFEEFSKHYSMLDVFINNAGVTKKSAFLDTTEELFDEIVSVDYKGAFFCMQKASKIMVDNGTQGNIILISSNNAIAHFADVSVYGSVKTAVNKLTEHIAIELAKYKIRAPEHLFQPSH